VDTMPTFEEVLRTTVSGVNEQYDRANRDLHRVVAEVSKSVQAASNGLASVVLRRTSEGSGGATYKLVLKSHRDSEERDLAAISVPLQGYPIQVAGAAPPSLYGLKQSADELTGGFQKMASDPNSPLVAFVAYLLRNRAEDSAEEAEAPG